VGDDGGDQDCEKDRNYHGRDILRITGLSVAT
jgi:hypothetical protein